MHLAFILQRQFLTTMQNIASLTVFIRMANACPLFCTAQSMSCVIHGHCLLSITLAQTLLSLDFVAVFLVQQQCIRLTILSKSIELSLNPICCLNNMKYQYTGWSSSRMRLTMMSLFLSIKYGSNKLLIRQATHFVKCFVLKSSVYSMYQLSSVNIAMSSVP